MNKCIKYAIDHDQTNFKGDANTGNRRPEMVVMFRCRLAF